MASSNRVSKSKRRKAEETLRLLKQSGAVDDNFTLEDLFDQLNIVDTEEDRILEAEAVILYFDLKGAGFREHTCPVCKQKFASKYSVSTQRIVNPPKIHNSMKPEQKLKVENEIKEIQEDKDELEEKWGLKCSNFCRALALREMGIQWNPYRKPEDRWSMPDATKGELPAIVPPPAYELLTENLGIKAAVS